jgi:hypothetical protein
MLDLPITQQGHPPLDTCHKTHSGVTVHMPGCACAGPSEVVEIKDAAGNVTERRVVKVVDHVMVHEAGSGTTYLSLEDARLAGFISVGRTTKPAGPPLV